MQTRAQAKREEVISKLKTPSIIDITINPEQVSNAQKEDISVTKTRNRCEANETIGKATFFKKNDLLYRKFSSPNVEQGKIFEQLIVPEQYRELVLQLAHESILTGHLSVTSSVHKVLSEYYCTVGNQNGSFRRKCAFPVPFGGKDGSSRRKMVREKFETGDRSHTDR